MPTPELNVQPIEVLLAEYYLREVLVASAEVAAVVGTRCAPALDGFEPSEFLADGAPISDAWPYVLFGLNQDPMQDMFAGGPTLQSDEYLVRCFMREDLARALGQDFQDIAAAAVPALQKALGEAGPLVIDTTDTTGRAIQGLVHGCELLPDVHRAGYGERGQRIAEAGVNVRVTFN